MAHTAQETLTRREDLSARAAIPVALLAAFTLLCSAISLRAEDKAGLSGIIDDLASGTTLRLKNLTYGVVQDVKSTPVNPDNVLGLPSHTMESDIRLDAFHPL